MITHSLLRAGLIAAKLVAFALPASAAEAVRVEDGHHGTIIFRMVRTVDYAAGKFRVAEMETNTQSDAIPSNYDQRALPGAGAQMQIGRGIGR